MDDVRRLAHGMRRVLASIDTALDPREVLYGLVEVAVDVVQCDRAAVLAVENDRLVPRAVWGRRPNQQLFRRFRRMAAIPLDEARRAVLEGERVVVFDDTSTTDVVPAAWRDAFHTSSLALVPVTSEGSFHGLLAVDYISHHSFTDNEIELVRALAELARVAMRSASNAALGDGQRQTASRLRDAMDAIGGSESEQAVLTALEAGVGDVLPGVTATLSIGSSADRPPSSRGFVDTPVTVATHEGPSLRVWLRSRSEVDEDGLAIAEALARQAGVALRSVRAQHSVRVLVRQLGTIGQLPTALQTGPLPSALARAAGELFEPHAIEWCDIAFRDPRIAALAATRTLVDREVALLNRLVVERRTIGALDAFGLAGAVVEQNGRPAGLLIVRLRSGTEDTPHAAIVAAVAHAAGAAVSHQGMRRAMHHLERRISAQTSRLSIAEQLHDTVAVALDRMWSRIVADTTEPASDALGRLNSLRGLVVEAGVATHVLSASFAAQRVGDVGLAEALHDLVDAFERTSTTAVVLRVPGAGLDEDRERAAAAFAVVFEGLALQAAARSSVVVINIGVAPLRVTIRDDGIPLSQRADAMRAPSLVLSSIKERVATAGGTVSFRTASPRGVALEAVFPTETVTRDEVRDEQRPATSTPSV